MYFRLLLVHVIISELKRRSYKPRVSTNDNLVTLKNIVSRIDAMSVVDTDVKKPTQYSSGTFHQTRVTADARKRFNAIRASTCVSDPDEGDWYKQSVWY